MGLFTRRKKQQEGDNKSEYPDEIKFTRWHFGFVFLVAFGVKLSELYWEHGLPELPTKKSVEEKSFAAAKFFLREVFGIYI